MPCIWKKASALWHMNAKMYKIAVDIYLLLSNQSACKVRFTCLANTKCIYGAKIIIFLSVGGQWEYSPCHICTHAHGCNLGSVCKYFLHLTCTGMEGAAANAQIKQMEQQNSRLKEAIMRYDFCLLTYKLFYCCTCTCRGLEALENNKPWIPVSNNLIKICL